MSSSCSCAHVNTIEHITSEDLLLLQQAVMKCDSCEARGPNLWICLHPNCCYIGCGESAKDHSSEHSQEYRHCLTLNQTTLRIWCYLCEREVFRSNYHQHSVQDKREITTQYEKYLSPVDDSDSDSNDVKSRGFVKPRGLTGLRNIGNTCYMNAALQALSNCPALKGYFLECSGYIINDKKAVLAKCFMKLISEMWHKKRPSYVVPTGVLNSIKTVHPMFRGYLQHDSQEFLRCFMDRLHEELKQNRIENDNCQYAIAANFVDSTSDDEEAFVPNKIASCETDSPSDTDYDTCESRLNSENSSVIEAINSDRSCASIETTCRLTVSDLDVSSISQSDQISEDTCSDVRMESNSSVHVEVLNSITNIADSGILEFTNIKNLKDSVNLANKHYQKNLDDFNAKPSHFGDEVIVQYEYDNSDSKLIPTGTTVAEQETPTDVQNCIDNMQGQFTKTKILSSSSQKQELPQDEYLTKSSSTKTNRQEKRKQNVQYSSIISDVFDGKIPSSVQCLTCERVSCTNETFQDLSLPIPNKDQLHLLHMSSIMSKSTSPQKALSDDPSLNGSWLSWMFGWVFSWLWGPVVQLRDCLAAFFSSDDLKGDNMYSCEKCKKLRNGVKYSKVIRLPEILCIHLKRFRHEFMFSSKISSFVSFPLEGLDMKPYVHKDCKDHVMVYDLVSVICHHGTAGGGHYTTYALNYINETWYEYDDQIVTEVDLQQVENCQAYVLFYRKRNDEAITLRQKASQIAECSESSFMKFYISRQWINKFNTFAEPGPISNYDFLCKHGDVQPSKWPYVTEMVTEISQNLWKLLHSRFGGGPAANHLSQCQSCSQEIEKLKRRQQLEMETFVQLHTNFQRDLSCGAVYAMSLMWFRDWENFVRAKTDEPPSAIDNSKICIVKNDVPVILMNSDYGQISEDMWHFLYSIYGGGPELILKQAGRTSPHNV